jgi:hypothetical protein
MPRETEPCLGRRGDRLCRLVLAQADGQSGGVRAFVQVVVLELAAGDQLGELEDAEI